MSAHAESDDTCNFAIWVICT